MESSFRSVVRGFHVYKDVWSPTINHELPTQQEHGNPEDQHAVAIVKAVVGDVVGHAPREISRICWHFLSRGGTITCIVTGSRQRSFLPEGGLEIPCIYRFQGKKKLVEKLNSLLIDMKYEPIKFN